MRGLRFACVPLAVVSVASLPGCATKQETGTVMGAAAGGLIGNSFGHGNGRVLATVAGAVAGGIIGSEIGKSLDRRDRILAREAEMDALERGESGRPRRWRNPDNGRYGEVVPSRAYRRGGVDCRDYTHTIYIDGRPQAMHGTACRNPDGSWSNVG